MSDDKKLMEPRKRSLEQIMETYERIGKFGTAPDRNLKERSSKDPFGLQESKENQDPWHNAKEVTVRVVKFFMLASEEFGLGPKEMLYAAELAALNILNARDIPLKPQEIQVTRDAAAQYYQDSLPAIPDPKK